MATPRTLGTIRVGGQRQVKTVTWPAYSRGPSKWGSTQPVRREVPAGGTTTERSGDAAGAIAAASEAALCAASEARSPDGTNAVKALRGEKAAVHSGVPYFVAVRHGSLKYIRYLGAEEPAELYDLNSDPEELTNLAEMEAHRETRNRLHALLKQELTRADADFIELLDKPRAKR